MRLFDITDQRALIISHVQLRIIRQDCSQFLHESGGMPIYKSITSDHTFKKVKVRYRKTTSTLSDTFDHAFEDKTSKLSKRLVSVNGTMINSESTHYIFPKNNYKFLYNPTVSDYTKDLQHVVEAISEENFSSELSNQLLQYQYESSNIQTAIQSNAEILIYKIPYYYAIPTSLIEYETLLDLVK